MEKTQKSNTLRQFVLSPSQNINVVHGRGLKSFKNKKARDTDEITDLPTVNSNFALDNCLISHEGTQPGCLIDTPRVAIPEEEILGHAMGLIPNIWDYIHPTTWAVAEASCVADIKPVAAHMLYMEKQSVPSGVTEKYTFTKKKGYTSSFEVDASVKLGVSAGIFKCETSLEVTSGFSYGETIETEETESFEEQVVGPNDYWVYQPCIYYVLRARVGLLCFVSPAVSSEPILVEINTVLIDASAYRNTPTVINEGMEPYSRDAFLQYLSQQEDLLGVHIDNDGQYVFDPPLVAES